MEMNRDDENGREEEKEQCEGLGHIPESETCQTEQSLSSKIQKIWLVLR